MIVPAGGLSPEGRWVACRPGFFLPVRVLSRLHRRLFLEALAEAAYQRCYVHFLRNALDYVPRRVDDDCLQELRLSSGRPKAGPGRSRRS